MKYPKPDPRVQYKADNAKPKRAPYVHPLLTGIQMGCRTRLTLGYDERDMTNYPAAARFAQQVAKWGRRISQENREYAEGLLSQRP